MDTEDSKMRRKNITIFGHQAKWVEQNDFNLSQFVQRKLQVEMDKN